jgi:hypothetical protein
MTNAHAGGCQCRRVRYSLEGPILALYIGHYRDCQKQSGSAFGMILVVRGESLHLTSGELNTFETGTESGRIKTCAFCANVA